MRDGIFRIRLKSRRRRRVSIKMRSRQSSKRVSCAAADVSVRCSQAVSRRSRRAAFTRAVNRCSEGRSYPFRERTAREVVAHFRGARRFPTTLKNYFEPRQACAVIKSSKSGELALALPTRASRNNVSQSPPLLSQ